MPGRVLHEVFHYHERHNMNQDPILSHQQNLSFWFEYPFSFYFFVKLLLLRIFAARPEHATKLVSGRDPVQ